MISIGIFDVQLICTNVQGNYSPIFIKKVSYQIYV